MSVLGQKDYKLIIITYMSSYTGLVNDALDVMYLIQAARSRLVPLSDMAAAQTQREALVRPGSAFIFLSTNDQITRWRDGRRWHKSRINGPFLVYTEREESPNSSEFRHRGINLLKPRLIKKAITVPLNNGEKYQIISYYENNYPVSLPNPSSDPMFRQLELDHSLFPSLTRDGLYGKNRPKVTGFGLQGLITSQDTQHFETRDHFSSNKRHSIDQSTEDFFPASNTSFNPLQDQDYMAFLEEALENALGDQGPVRQSLADSAGSKGIRFVSHSNWQPGSNFRDIMRDLNQRGAKYLVSSNQRQR